MKVAKKPLSRLLRDLFRFEPLEPRLLLSADPVLGAAQLVLAAGQQEQDPSVHAYAADVAVPTAPGSTVLVTQGTPTQAVPSEWLVVDASQLLGGNGTLLVGQEDGNAVILLGEEGQSLDLGGLVLLNPQAGGEVYLRSNLSLSGSLLVVGSGHTFNIEADTDTDANIQVDDSVTVKGDRTLIAGNDGSGTIQLGRTSDSINGNGDTLSDTLVLRSPGSITIKATVGNSDPLERLEIGGVMVGGVLDLPDNVTFEREVVVNGDLVINASGNVTFGARVTITGGGSLIITGAAHVTFKELALTGTKSGTPGNIFIEADEIDFTSGSETVSGSGTLTLRPTTVGAAIEIATPPNSTTAGVLNLDMNEIRTFVDGFSAIIIGHKDSGSDTAHLDAGHVRIGAIQQASQPTFRDPLFVYGNSITVEDYLSSQYKLQVLGSIRLDAVNDIVLRNHMESWVSGTYGDVVLYSASGQVVQQDPANTDGVSGEPVRAGKLTVVADKGISLPYTEVASVSATNKSSGALAITETADGQGVEILLLRQEAAAAGLSLATTNGSITVSGQVSNLGTGATSLTANGAAGSITVNQAIASTGGTITLTAAGAIVTDDGAATDGTITTQADAAITLTSTSGAITQGGLIQSAGGTVTLDAFGALMMNDGVTIQSLHATTDTGAVVLKAGGNATVSRVVVDGSVSITAGGAILDGLTGDDPNLDGETAAALLAAASGIGTSSKPLQTRLLTLAASNTTSGGLFVREATALILTGSGTNAVEVGGSGVVSIVTADGALTVGKAVLSTGSVGHILLQSGEAAEGTAADLTIGANVSTLQGSISLLSADDIEVDNGTAGAPQVQASAAGQTIDLEAGGGISMEADALLQASDGTIRLVALGGNVGLGSVQAGSSGSISIRASDAILDNQVEGPDDPVNLQAGWLRLEAGGDIGTGANKLEASVDYVAADAGGDLVLSALANLVVGTVGPVSVNRVGADGALASTPTDDALSGLVVGGAAMVHVLQDLTVDQSVDVDGHLRLSALGALAVSANVQAAGSISVVAGNSLDLGAVTLESTAGTVGLESTGAGITMADDAVVRTDARNIRVKALGGIALGHLDARKSGDPSLGGQGDWGDVSLVAGGSITDGDAATDVHARNLRVHAGDSAGAADAAIETEVSQFSAVTTAGLLFMVDETALAVTTTAAITVDRVGFDGLLDTAQTDAAQSGIQSGAALVLETTAGTLAVEQAVAAGGNLRLGAGGGTSDLRTTGQVSSTGGHVSLAAGQDIDLQADVVATGEGKTIDLLAQGQITQAAATSIASQDGNVALEALGGNVFLNHVDAGTAGVRIAGQNIFAQDDGTVEIVAGSAQLLADQAIGTSAAVIDLSVGTLAATAGTGMYLEEADGVTVGSLQVNVQRVRASDGDTEATTHDALEDLTGPVVVLTAAQGDLAIDAGTAGTAGVNATTAVRLQAVAGAVLADATVDAGGGFLTVLGETGVAIAAGAELATSGAGTVDVEAAAGSIDMADGAVVRTEGGDIRLRAGGDIRVGVVDARKGGLDHQATDWGDVSLHAGGSITDNPGETAVDVHARQLRLQAGAGIGAGDEHLETEVATLSATTGAGGIYLSEATQLAIGTTAEVVTQRVTLDGTTVDVTSAEQAGVASAGAAVVRTFNGALAVQDTVEAAGNLLLQANGADSDLTVLADVTSTGGHLSLWAGQDLDLQADLAVETVDATMDLVAGGDFKQAQGSAARTTGGSLGVDAAGTATLEWLDAGTGAVRVAAAAIVDGDADDAGEFDITAGRLTLVASGSAGTSGAALEVSVDALSTDLVGDLFLTEANALAIDTFGDFTVQRVGNDGEAGLAVSTAISGIRAATAVVRALGGSITSSGEGAIDVTNHLLLQAASAGSDIGIGAAVSAAGALSFEAGRDIVVASSVSTTTAGSTVDFVAQENIDLQQGSSVSAADANVLLRAKDGSVTVESVAAGSGTVHIRAFLDVVDGDADGDAEVDITAAGLLVQAGGSVGTGANALETAVGTLAATAGHLYLLEADDLLLDTTSGGITRVGEDGSTSTAEEGMLSGVSSGTLVLRTTAGTLESKAGNEVNAAGNLLLQAGGDSSDLVLGELVTSTGGHATLQAGQDLLQNANVSTTSADGKSLQLLAGRHLTQAQGVQASSSGDLRVEAGGVVTLEGLFAAGGISVVGASIVDGDDDGDDEVDIQAMHVLLKATGGAIGAAGNHLETAVATLSASATSHVFVTEDNDLSLEQVTVTTRTVADDGSDAEHQVAQANVTGDKVVVRTSFGSLSSQASGAVQAGGHVLLQARDADSDLALGAAVTSTGGSISLDAQRHVLLGAIEVKSETGDIDVRASRAVAMLAASQLTAAGALRIRAGEDATITGLTATAAEISAGGSILDAGDDRADLTAASAWLHAEGDIGGFAGGAASALDLAVATLTAHSAGGTVQLAEADAVTVGAAKVDVLRVDAEGAATLVDGTEQRGIRTGGGAIELRAGGAVTLDSSDTQAALESSGQVTLTAGGAVTDTDNDFVDVAAGTFTLTAAGPVGTGADAIEQAVQNLQGSVQGAIHLWERDDVTVSGLSATQAGPLVLRAAGSITATGAVGTANGHVLLESTGGIIAVGSTVTAGTAGHLSVQAQGNIDVQAAGKLVAAGGGSVDVESRAGSVTMAHGAVAQTDGGDLRIAAAEDVFVGLLDARTVADRNANTRTGQAASWGNVSVQAGFLIEDNAGETAVDVYARSLRLEAGTGAVGTGDEHLETEVAILSGKAGGSFYVTESTALEIGTTSAVTVQRVGSDGATLAPQTDGAQSGIEAADVVVVAKAGSLNVRQAVAANGNVLLQADGAASDLVLAADVTAQASVSGLAGRDLLQTALVRSEGEGSTVDLQAQGKLDMSNGGRVQTYNGNVWLVANTGDLVIGRVDAGQAGVLAKAAGAGASIVDGSDDAPNVIAGALQLVAGNAIGPAAAALEISVGALAAQAGTGGIFLSEADGVTVGVVNVDAERVTATGGTSAQAGTAQEDLKSGGLVILTLDAGDLLLEGGTASPNLAVEAGTAVLLQAPGTITVNAGVQANAAISVVGGSVEQGVAGDFTSASSTIDVEATDGHIAMDDGAVAQTSGQNIRYRASGGITLGLLDARTNADRGGSLTNQGTTWGLVSVQAGGGIADRDDGGAVDIYARQLRLASGEATGSGGNHLETEAALLSAQAGSGFYVQDQTALTVGATSVVMVQRVSPQGTLSDRQDGAQEDLRVDGGEAVLATAAGTLTLAAGTVDATGVAAAGPVRLQALAGAVVVQGAIEAAGSVSVLASAGVTQQAAIGSTGGTIDVLAAAGDIAADGATAWTHGGNIRYAASGDIRFGLLDARSAAARDAGTLEGQEDDWGRVSLVAGGSVSASDDATPDVYASTLRFEVDGSVGTGSLPLTSEVAAVHGRAGGALFLLESTALRIDGSGDATVLRLRPDAGDFELVTDGELAGLEAGAQLVVRNQAAGISTVAGHDVFAQGHLMLAAATSLGLAANVGSATGHLHLGAADGGVLQVGDVYADNGSAYLHASGTWAMVGDAAITASMGSVALEAGGTVAVGRISAGGTVSIAAGSVVDSDDAGDTDTDITAASLRLDVAGAVGEAGNALETRVDTLAARVGNLFLSEFDALVVGSVGYAAPRATAQGGQEQVERDTLDGIQAAILALQSGGLTVTQAVSASGNLLLQAVGAASNLLVQAAVSGGGEAVTLAAGLDLRLQADVEATRAGAFLTLYGEQHVVQDQGRSASTNGGVLVVHANTGDVTLEHVAAGAGTVLVLAQGDIVDGDAADDADADIEAAQAILMASGSIGSAGAALETEVGSLSAAAGGNLFITEFDSLAVTRLDVAYRKANALGQLSSEFEAGGSMVYAQQDLVLRTLLGELDLQASAVIMAGADALVQAGGVGSDLLLAGSVNAAGSLSLDAGRHVHLLAASAVSADAGTLDVLAGGAITMAQGTRFATGGGALGLQATGDVTLELVHAGAGTVRIAGANILDGDTGEGDTPEVDIQAGQLLLTATGAIGEAGNALDIQVGTLSALAGGGIALHEADALLLDGVTFMANRVGADGVATPMAPVTQADVGSTGAGAISLVAQGDIDFAPNADVRTTGAGTIAITSKTGHVLMDPDTSRLESGTGNLYITAEGDIRPGALATGGQAFLDALNGDILIEGDLERDGEDIDLIGDDLTIRVPVSSPGATLTIGPRDLVPVIIGGPPPAGEGLHLDVDELGLLEDGFAQIVIGSDLDGQQITLRGSEVPLEFRDPLVLKATGDGGTVEIIGALHGDTLTILDTGAGTTLTGGSIAMQGDVTIQDDVVVSGSNTIEAGQGGTGTLQVTGDITGQGGVNDVLTLAAQGGDVVVDGNVGNLDGLSVTGAVNVTFGGAVTIDGDLVIEATGVVTFTGPVTMQAGGQLIVRGGGQVVFANTVDFGTADAVLEVDAITANGGAGSITGTGALDVRGSDPTQAIHIGSGATAGALQITDQVLRAIGDTFSVVRIGGGATASAGAITIGDSDFTGTSSPVEVLGSSITVSATGGGLQVGTNLTLHAQGGISTSGSIVATGASNLVLASDSGGVTMAAGASIASGGGNIQIDAAGDVALASLDARGAGGAAGTVVIRSTGGTVTDANGDTGVDIYARAIDFIGTGPAAGAGDVLEVSADLVHVQAPAGGLVVRESGADGRTYYNIVQGDTVQQALVAVGPSARVTTDTADYTGDPNLMDLLTAGFRDGIRGQQAVAAGLPTLGMLADAGPPSQAGIALSEAPSTEEAPEFLLSQRLLDETGVTFATGQSTGDGTGVDWWLETMAL